VVNSSVPGRWFRRTLWVAILANLAWAMPTIAAPSVIVALGGLPTAGHDLWPRLAAVQALALSGLYVPAAIDIDRYRLVAWFAVAAHAIAGMFFLFEAGYRLFAVYDAAFAVSLGVLLAMAVRSDRAAASRTAVASL
jgi:hypothetical protein